MLCVGGYDNDDDDDDDDDNAVCRHLPSVAVDDDDDGVDNVSSIRDTASSEQRLPSVATVLAHCFIHLYVNPL